MSQPESFHSIFARNCEVRRIDRTTASAFLDRCHLYGDCAAKYRYGVFVKRYSGTENRSADSAHPYPIGTLVAVASFSNARRWDKDGIRIRSYEWLRYASLPQVRVIGGMGRVLSTFIEEVHPDDIMSYAPAQKFEGEVYLKLGFVCEGLKTFSKEESDDATSQSSSYKFRLKLTNY